MFFRTSFDLASISCNSDVRDCGIFCFTGTVGYNCSVTKFLKDEKNVQSFDGLKVIHLKEFIHHLQEKGFKASYINAIIKSNRAYFNYLVKEEYISSQISAHTVNGRSRLQTSALSKGKAENRISGRRRVFFALRTLNSDQF